MLCGLNKDLGELGLYRYSGHTTLVGKRKYPWQDTGAVLGRFGADVWRTREQDEDFVAEGVFQGPRPELQGGGLVRNSAGWVAAQELRRGREEYAADERILGASAFVEEIRQEGESGTAQGVTGRSRALSLEVVLEQGCQGVGVRTKEVAGAGRRAALCQGREGVAYLWIEWSGHSGLTAARAVGIRPEEVYRVVERGRQEAKHWRQVLER